MAKQHMPPPADTSRFRFSTRDLLLFTAAVAVYVFALLHLLRWEEGGRAGPSWIVVQLSIMLNIGGSLAGLVWYADRRVKNNLGKNQVQWRRPCDWKTVFRLLFLSLLAALLITPFPNSISIFLGMLLGCGALLLVPIRVGTQGVSHQVGIIVPWTRYDLEFDAFNSTLTFKDDQNEWLYRLLIPERRCQQVEHILRDNGPYLITALARPNRGRFFAPENHLFPCDEAHW